MVDASSKGAVRDVLAYNLNIYVISLVGVTVGLWVVGFPGYAIIALLILLLLIITQNLWLAYNGLLE